jgi:sugar lactone lactonase YvrE
MLTIPGRFIAVSALVAAVLGAGSAAAAASPRTIWTVAGTGASCAAAPGCGDGGPATAAAVSFPEGVATDGSGNVYVVDWGDNEIRRISPGGAISVVAGDGTPCDAAPSCGDGGRATSAQLSFPTAVSVDSRGDLFIADAGADEIREVLPNGTITRFAGTGQDCPGGTCGDGGPARSAQLTSPDGVAVDRSGNVYIADTGDNLVRKVARDGTILTVAGDGSQCRGAPACGDGTPAVTASLNFPEAVALDARGNLYIADNGDNEVREVTTHGTIIRVAGSGTACAAAPACGDGGSAVRGELNAPEGIAVDRGGNLYIADWGDSEIREVSHSGTITRLAGNGVQCAAAPSCGDTGAAANAALSSPHGVAVDAAGNVYIGDSFDDEVRVVPATGSPPSRLRGAHGSLFVLAFATTTSRRAVAVQYVLSGSAAVSLRVTAKGGHPLLAARAHGTPGLGTVNWNRRLGSRAAPRGRYTLTVTIASGRLTASSSISVGL